MMYKYESISTIENITLFPHELVCSGTKSNLISECFARHISVKNGLTFYDFIEYTKQTMKHMCAKSSKNEREPLNITIEPGGAKKHHIWHQSAIVMVCFCIFMSSHSTYSNSFIVIMNIYFNSIILLFVVATLHFLARINMYYI